MSTTERKIRKGLNTSTVVLAKMMYKKPGLISKLSAPRMGPYRITETYANSTVRIQCGVVNERVNIRQLTPYKEHVLPN
jgi:hypothetical protein